MTYPDADPFWAGLAAGYFFQVYFADFYFYRPDFSEPVQGPAPAPGFVFETDLFDPGCFADFDPSAFDPPDPCLTCLYFDCPDLYSAVFAAAVFAPKAFSLQTQDFLWPGYHRETP
ncbi:MAG TPA: hypothetical protein VJ879_13295 [Desulfobacter sp.]|nr:hypothetical protein [Desulfobacter sp.]